MSENPADLTRDGTGFVRLLHSTGKPSVDEAVRSAVAAFEAAFPGRVLAAYLYGSHASGGAVGLSDVDLCVLFEGDFASDDEQQRAWRLASAVGRLTGGLVDLAPWSLASLEQRLFLRAAIKLAGVLVHGRDVRPELALPRADAYAGEVLPVSVTFPSRLRGGTQQLVYPLGYPDPDGAFFGYDQAEVDTASGDTVPSTRLLVRTAAACAVCVLAVRAGRVVGSKAEAVGAYGADVGAGAGVLAAIWHSCRLTWGYRIPTNVDDRRRLRGLCAGVPELENELLRAYREFGAPKAAVAVVFP